MNSTEFLAFLAIFLVLASIGLWILFFPPEPMPEPEQPPEQPEGPPEQPPQQPPIQPVEPPDTPYQPEPKPVETCPSTPQEIGECESLFGERMDNIEYIFGLNNPRRPFSDPEYQKSFSADDARQAYSSFIKEYKSCSQSVSSAYASLIQELRAIDSELGFVNWNNTDLEKIVCVEVSA
jgi:hypothetical protein